MVQSLVAVMVVQVVASFADGAPRTPEAPSDAPPGARASQEATASSVASAVHASAADPLVGAWYGTAGFPEDEVEFGVEITTLVDGTPRVRLWEPVLNIFGYDVPSGVTLEADTIAIDDMRLRLTLSGTGADESLRGTMSSVEIPIALHRVETLPTEPPIPDLPTGPGAAWRTTLGSPIYAPPAILNGVAYIGSTGGIFQAVRVSDGEILWSFPAGRPIFGGAAATPDGVFFVCDNGYLFRLDPATGEEGWRYDLGDARAGRLLGHPQIFDYDCRSPVPLVEGGRVYVGAGDGSFHAVDAATGARLWKFQSGDKVRGGAACDSARVYFGSADHFVYALDRATGGLVWKQDLRGAITSAPVVIDGMVVIGTRESSSLLALKPETGERVWRDIYWGSWVESEPVERDGLIYIGSSDLRRVCCYTPGDGRLQWRTDVFGWAWGTPVVTHDRIYVATSGVLPYPIRHAGGVLGLDRASGRVLWRWAPPDAPGVLHTGFASGPALDADMLVVGGLDGSLYGFRVGAEGSR